MPATDHTGPLNASEQKFWDETFQKRWPDCVKEFGDQGEQYCLHRAADFSDLALAERRRSQGRKS